MTSTWRKDTWGCSLFLSVVIPLSTKLQWVIHGLYASHPHTSGFCHEGGQGEAQRAIVRYEQPVAFKEESCISAVPTVTVSASGVIQLHNLQGEENNTRLIDSGSPHGFPQPF